jgi:formiminotetrahydrofolate cyclodeaminase
MNKSTLKQRIREEIISILSETTYKVPSDRVDDIQPGIKDEDTVEIIDEDDDYEGPTARQAKKGDSVSTLANKLGETKREMKQVVKDYKKAEGEEKLQYVKRLKELTSIKKELEQLLDNPKPAYQDDAF